jgi:predicted transcriptional regulator
MKRPAHATRSMRGIENFRQLALRFNYSHFFILRSPPETHMRHPVYDVVYNQALIHMSTTMTIRLDDDIKDRLDFLADATQRSKSFLAAEAIRAFIETNEWQIGEIQAALKEADAGDFASDKDVAALAKKWR